MAQALKPLLSDLASSIFYAALIAITGNIFLATGIGMAIGIGQIGFEYWRRKPIALMQWMSLGLVIVFGSLTLILHDDHFVVWKFAIAHVAIGAAMITPNWMSRYLPKIVTDTLSRAELTLYSAMWPVFMFSIAAGGIYVREHYGTAGWVWFLTFINAPGPWVLFGIQYLLIRTHVVRVLRRREAAHVPAE